MHMSNLLRKSNRKERYKHKILFEKKIVRKMMLPHQKIDLKDKGNYKNCHRFIGMNVRQMMLLHQKIDSKDKGNHKNCHRFIGMTVRQSHQEQLELNSNENPLIR